jgi:hypothetical protein
MRILVLLALALTVADPASAASKKKAAKLLKQLKTVDGAGSGLDADTVQGKTPGELGGSGLVVKDANGALVGRVLDGGLVADEGTFVWVVRTVGTTPVRLGVTGAGFARSTSVFQYATPDCTGPARVYQHLEGRILLPSGVVLGGRVFFPTGDVVSLPAGSGSEERTSDTDTCTAEGGVFRADRGTCCVPTTFSDDPTAPVTEAAIETLVPPFHVEAQ